MSFATAVYTEMHGLLDERIKSHGETIDLDLALSALKATQKDLFRKYHPDKSVDEDAEAKFKCIKPASDQLEKKVKREYNEDRLQDKRDKAEIERLRTEREVRQEQLAAQYGSGLKTKAPGTVSEGSRSPNKVALSKLEDIATLVMTNKVSLPMKNATQRLSEETFKRKLSSLRSLLRNEFEFIPISSSEPDLWRILNEVATMTLPKWINGARFKLPSAITLLFQLQKAIGIDRFDPPCDVSPPSEPDITSTPEQQNTPPCETKPTPTSLKKERTNEEVEATRPKKKSCSSLARNTIVVLQAARNNTIVIPEKTGGGAYAKASINRYCKKVESLLTGAVAGVTIDAQEANPFGVMEKILKEHGDIIHKEDECCNRQLSCGITFFLKLRDQFPQLEV